MWLFLMRRLLTRMHAGSFWSDGNIVYFDQNDGHMAVCTCKKTSSYSVFAFYRM